MTQVLWPILLLVVGFVLLVYGADFFVDGCCSIAKTLRIPSIIIGLTIVALGTSAPEAAVSITAALNGSSGISAGNCVGSNFFNLLVIVGLCAVFAPVPVSRDIIKRDFPFSLFVEGLVLLVFCDFAFGKTANVLGRVAGITLFALYLIYIGILVFSIRKSRQVSTADADDDDDIKTMSVPKSLILIICGGAAVVFGGNIVVDNASIIARFFGMSETLIGLTIVALGTSLPELVTSFVAAKKGEVDLALGNCIGSNIANFLFVLGLSATVRPIAVDMNVLIDTTILIVACIIVYAMCLTGRRLSRKEGVMMILMYAAYTAYIFMRNYGVI